MLAEVMKGMISASAPRVQRPKLSPMSQLRSMTFSVGMVDSSLPGQHAGQGVDETVDVVLGHGQRAGAQAARREQDPLVEQPQEHPEGRLGIARPAGAVVGER